MKPKDLKYPYTWEERRPLLCDRIFYVPEYYAKHANYVFPPWTHPDLFGREAPIEVEYCSGNGAWIVEKALAHPDRDWVAIDLRFDRARKIWSKIHNFNLRNLFVVCGEALTFTQHYVSASSFSAAYVNFPDPWPKEKHAKNRLLQESFFLELSRVLLPGAQLTVTTDHADYSQAIIESLQSSSPWEPCYPHPYYVNDYPGYGTSYFDALWKEKGMDIYYIQFILKQP